MGQFNGLKDKEWSLIEHLIPYRYARGRGKQPIHPRKALNSMIWILMTGARWCDIPKGSHWASKSCAHQHLGIWKENGLLEKILIALQEIGVLGKAIDLSRLSIDGFFSAGKGGGENVKHGYKGKGVTTHLMTDGLENPLRFTSSNVAGDERVEVVPLLKKISGWLGPLISRGTTPILEADKGYDCKELRLAVLSMKIFPFIPYRRIRSHREESVVYLEKRRWTIERGISWLQRKFRRLLVRWERKMKYWEGFLTLGLMMY